MSESDNMPLPVTAIQDESSELEAEQQRVLRDYRDEIQNAQKEADNAYETITAAHEERLAQAVAKSQAELAKVKQQHQMQLEELNAEHNSQIDSAHGLSNAQIAADKSKAEELQQKFETELAEQSDKHAREIDVMVEAMRRQQVMLRLVHLHIVRTEHLLCDSLYWCGFRKDSKQRRKLW